jgi:enoyl-CoA hydratase/carnithine racemase
MTTTPSDGTATDNLARPAALAERIDSIGIVKLNRPEKRNAVNEQMSAEALDALDAFEQDAGIRCIILTGAGDQSFCAGQDMAEASGRVERPAEIRGGGASGLARRVAATEKPVIAAVNGFCYGGGMSIALSCDFRLASEAATFRLPGASYGLVVAATLLTAAVGPAMAKDLTYTARTFDAQEALRIGLVNRLLPPSDLLSTAIEYAQMISANSPLAVAHAKQVIDAAAISMRATQREAEANRVLRGGEDNVARFNEATDRVVRRR